MNQYINIDKENLTLSKNWAKLSGMGLSSEFWEKLAKKTFPNGEVVGVPPSGVAIKFGKFIAHFFNSDDNILAITYWDGSIYHILKENFPSERKELLLEDFEDFKKTILPQLINWSNGVFEIVDEFFEPITPTIIDGKNLTYHDWEFLDSEGHSLKCKKCGMQINKDNPNYDKFVNSQNCIS